MRFFIASMVCFFVAASVHAQGWEPDLKPSKKYESVEQFGLELRGGPYTPVVGGAVWNDHIDDSGPLLGLGIDFYPLRIPYVGLIGAGFGVGFATFSGSGVDGNNQAVDEKTELNVYPLSAMAVLRVDVLWQTLRVPFVFTGKLGGDLVFWDFQTGNTNLDSGYSGGFRWAVQGSLYLDFLEPSSARSLDEEWGINHTFLFFELYGTTAGKSQDRNVNLSDTTWAIGLGATF